MRALSDDYSSNLSDIDLRRKINAINTVKYTPLVLSLKIEGLMAENDGIVMLNT